MPGTPWRYGHYVFGVIQAGLICAAAAAIASHPFVSGGFEPLDCVITPRLADDAAGRALRRAFHSESERRLDARGRSVVQGVKND
jgi:hypothetical protein